MNFRLPILLVALAALLSGCVTNASRDNHSSGDLNRWVEQELNPYLADQLGRHPRFRGESFLLVAMNGDQVEPDIDQLREEVRVQIFDHLLNVQGVNTAWRPAVRPWRHHRSLPELQCEGVDGIRYYVGIEAREDIDGSTRLSVRALDMKEGRWVSGFGKQWRGRLTPAQRDARSHRRPDEYLRGLRPLPFDTTQSDLTAAYLAHNLSCLLQKRALQRLVLHLHPNDGLPHFFATTLELVGNYLSRFREVRITDDPTQANVSLKGAVHHIHAGRYQVWLAATLESTGERLAGADTAAYVTLPFQETASAQMLQSEQPIDPGSGRLIESFSLMAPMSQALCRSSQPWAMGARQLEEGAFMAPGDCLGVELEMAHDAWVFLLHRDGRGDMTRLWPNDCIVVDERFFPEKAGALLAFPQLMAGSNAVMELDGDTGREQFLALATDNWDIAQSLRSAVGVCGTQADGRRVQQVLRRMREYSPDKLEMAETWVYQE